jgi:hypothetical protein
VVTVLLCLIVFVVTYLGLTVGSVAVCVWCFSSLGSDEPKRTAPTQTQVQGGKNQSRSYPQAARPPRNEKPVFWYLLGGIVSGLLCLFLVKGLFKRSGSTPVCA